MRKLFLSACCCLALQGAMAQVDGMTGASVQTKETSCGASCSATCCKKTHNTPACQLLDRLKKLQKRGIMLGHQDDPVYGTTWKWDEGKSDVLLTTGDYPAVMGFDLGKLAALTETGCRGISKKRDWFTKTLFPVLQSYPLSYVLFWRNAWDKPQEEAYLPGINDGEIVKDFQKLKAEKKILFANDVKKVKK